MRGIMVRNPAYIAILIALGLPLIYQSESVDAASLDKPTPFDKPVYQPVRVDEASLNNPTLPPRHTRTIEPGIVRTIPEVVEGEFLVRYRDEYLLTTPPLERATRINGIGKSIQRQFPKLQVTVIETYPDLGVQRFRLPKGVPLKEVIQQLKKIPEIQFIEPNYKIFPLFSAPPHDEHWTIDSLHLWGMNRIGMKRAWDVSRADIADNIIVAVIDTGIDFRHPDLRSQMWENPPEAASSAKTNQDDDNNGIRDDIHGVNYCWWTNESPPNPTGTPLDNYDGHGTAVAGVIGAKVSDIPVTYSYVAGVHRKAKLMALKVLCDPREHVDSSVINAVSAIDYAWKHGATVINASWYVAAGTDKISSITGEAPGSQILKEAIARARDHNALFIAAAGNSSSDRDNDLIAIYPANYGRVGSPDYLDNVIAVAATWDVCPGNVPVSTVSGSPNYGKCDNGGSPQEALWEQSHYGLETVSIAAPGWNTYTTMPLSLDPLGVTNPSGTSMAAPYVAGCAALLQAKRATNVANQPFTPKDLKEVLLHTADSAGITGIRDGLRLNCDRALQRERDLADQTIPSYPRNLVVK